MDLTAEIAAVREGRGDPGRLLGDFRRAVVLAPVAGGGLMSAESGGVRWLYAFTDEGALARFLGARGAAGDAEWEYVSILGARLLDAVIPSLDGPTGVAVDVADEDASMLFPPVPGIVPEAVAVDPGAGLAGGAR
ncbi:hypothetical protein [Streptomyces sp. FIT100]|uniref:hypothetical protein n=1 Tax=Streptomyces sp. FIT100 TaxID=2837956 RepID=UPI0021C75E9D|nr:hypothetical protein [Streptomyces sp. FIT100]UUN27459.1 hypothetical protein KK483_14415 [Streptomyces sp. FIT100]